MVKNNAQIKCVFNGLAMLIIIATVLTACKNNKQPVKKVAKDSVINIPKNLSVTDSLQLVQDIDSADYAYLFKNKTNIWIIKALNNPKIKWTDFRQADFYQVDSIKQIKDEPAKKLLEDYGMFLRWSPDSTYLLDFGSYGVTMARHKNGQLYIESGDIDSELRLFNIRKKTSARLMFHGSFTNTWDAHWADSAQVVLLGTFDTSANNHPDTTLWMINVKNNFFRRYVYKRQ